MITFAFMIPTMRMEESTSVQTQRESDTLLHDSRKRLVCRKLSEIIDGKPGRKLKCGGVTWREMHSFLTVCGSVQKCDIEDVGNALEGRPFLHRFQSGQIVQEVAVLLKDEPGDIGHGKHDARKGNVRKGLWNPF
jgi:hypothetical protein